MADSKPLAVDAINTGSTALAIARWLDQIYAQALSLQPNGRQYGLLGALLTVPQYLALPGPPDPFALTVRLPAPYPHAAAAAIRDQWSANDKTCAVEEAAMQTLRQSILPSIDPSMTIALRHPILGIAHLTLEQIVSHIRETYGVMSPAALADLQVYFRQPMRASASIEAVIAEHEGFHIAAANAGAPLSEFDKVQCLSSAVAGQSHYAFAISAYQHNHPTVAARTFAYLRGALLDAGRNAPTADPSMGLTAMAAPHSAYGAATQSTDPVPANHSPSANNGAATLVSAPSGGTAAVALAAARAPRTHQYCWYHGNCGHLGAACNLKDSVKGFKTQATKANPMGGARGNWDSVKAAILEAGGTVATGPARKPN